ncbi:VOC family protein [Arthrobacter cupressi]|uniref:Catechol 2,3-dioxygenase n=1 Tax=Arthrobacter cupressi TaxID=1045773 RepID=A0A1G8V6A9_9MICC|nr:VOC family protein [Arthrobacter cupressi]NYD78682.1 catechol 2,3-dioxygenase-like lactoylglutathione lyase family enzyme [Arthrobacter cupressi]SDJ61394.1 Catechol 2,3-dioxygenase [Arthrobacter cupressi]
MTAFRMDHVGVTVQDLDRAIAFFKALGFEMEGRQEVGGPWADRVNGLDGTEVDMAMMIPPGGGTKLELARFISPDPVGETDRPVNSFGFSHVCYEVEDVDAVIARARDAGYGLVRELVNYQDVYRLAYIRGPEGLLVEVAQAL